MFADDMLFNEGKPKKYQEELEDQLEDDELSFEEAAFLMGYNDYRN
ncbi:MAG: hypothetical protein AB7V77_02590 [Candidatus Woesearchaeota archaeon]